MIAIDIRTNFAAVERKLGVLRKDIHDKALASAINKTIDLGKTQMVRTITSEFNVKAAYVRERLRVRRASPKQGRFKIEGSLIGGKAGAKRSANIISFVEKSVTLAERKRRRKAGALDRLFVKVKRKGPRKALREGAFIGNKGRTVFRRIPGTTMDSRSEYAGTKHAEQIEPVQVIDVAQMFNTKRINVIVRKLMETRFAQVFEREARFYVQRFNSGVK